MKSKFSSIKDLRIIEPNDEARQFYKGDTKTLTYELQNMSHHPMTDIDVTVSTILKTSEKESLTKGKYIESIKFPKNLPGKAKGYGKIVVKVPFDYEEYIEREGERVEWPFRVKVMVKSLKRIEEL